jgi:hypothetical protein
VRLLVGLAAVSALTGCEMQPKPQITRRFLAAEHPPFQSGESYVSVSAFATDIPPKPPKVPLTLKLTERGQAEFVKAVGANVKSLAEFTSALTKVGILSPPDDLIDRGLIETRLVLSVVKTEAVLSPADRIDQLRLTIKVPPEKQKHVFLMQWDRFETEYGSVSLGDLSLTQSRAFEAKISAGPAEGETVPVSGEVTSSATNELTEEVGLGQRFVKLSGVLRPWQALLYEEGVVGIDLVGTTIVDMAIRVKGQRVPVYQFDLAGKPSLDEVEYRVVPMNIPLPEALPGGVQLQVGGSYRLRTVQAGDETIMEGDDVVRFVRGPLVTDGREAPVVITEKFLGRLRQRFEVRGANKKPLLIEGTLSEPLLFPSAEEAMGFVDWLRHAGGKGAIRLAGRPLLYEGGTPVDAGETAGLRVVEVTDTK